MREPHWHPNAWELDVVVSGEAVISILNPETNQLQNYHVKAGKLSLFQWDGGIGSQQ